MNRCSVTSMNDTLIIENPEHLKIFVEKLCSMSAEDLKKIFMEVLFEINYGKYLSMVRYWYLNYIYFSRVLVVLGNSIRNLSRNSEAWIYTRFMATGSQLNASVELGTPWPNLTNITDIMICKYWLNKLIKPSLWLFFKPEKDPQRAIFFQIGDMYFRMSGDPRLSTLTNMMTAVLRMMRLRNFLPPELVSIFQGQDTDFSYIQLNLWVSPKSPWFMLTLVVNIVVN